MVNFLLVGSGAREHAIAQAICRNPDAKLFAYMSANNPGIAALVKKSGGKSAIGDIHSPQKVSEFASSHKIDAWFESKTKALNDWQKAALREQWGTMQKVLSSPRSGVPSASRHHHFLGIFAGFRRSENYRYRVLFHCRKLDLLAETS